MAEKPKSLLEGGTVNALSEGAERFAQLIESVKAQQAARSMRRQPRRPTRCCGKSGEAWSRNFQSQSIAPDVNGFALADLAPLPAR